MTKFHTSFLSFLFLGLWSMELSAQCNPTPCQIPTPWVNAQDACALPAPSSLDCYFGTTTFDPPISLPPSWCTTVENNHFFAFTADAPTATFEICTFGCAAGSGIQAAVLSTADCITFAFVSACLGNIGSNSCQNLVANGLVPGEVYYLMIDGNAGAVCDYSINGVNPTISGPTANVCLPSASLSNYTANSISTWTINPPTAGNIIGNPIGTNISVQWLEPGDAEVCAQSLVCPNAPNLCLPISIGEDVMTDEPVIVCQGYQVECAGRTFNSNPGTFPVALDSYLGCDSVVNCIVSVIPTVFSTEFVNMCPGGSVSCAGEEFFGPGTYPVTLQGDNGCDSVVNCRVNLVLIPNMPFQVINLCGPNQFETCVDLFTETGLYSSICTGWLGCDSIVNVNLAILEPVANIAPPAILDCASNLVITLNGTGSNVNPAQGGSTIYAWSGPPNGIIGNNNTPTIQVNQPGEYCLVLTHGRGGVNCRDTTCVTVLQDAGIPQLPILTGVQVTCAGETHVYSATASGNPPPTSFNWTLPNNHPFTVLTPSSIEVTWQQGTPAGQLCVTANNSCGASPPACIPITVGDQPLLPVLSGPSQVCAAGGNFTYSVDTQQVGTIYNWTVPAGAVLTGSGGTVMIDFANAVSGQVCVVAQNNCDTLPAVCMNVQVAPSPGADLNGPSEICLGDSIVLTFSLTGNAPFDVIWSDGTQNFPENGSGAFYQRTLFPTVSTTYTLISVGDNSIPACITQALDTVQVTVHPLANTPQTIEICEGETAFLAGANQSMPGVYLDTLNTIFGCDSVIVSTLVVNQIDTTVVNQTTCDPAAAGTLTVTLPQVNGCDSIVTTITALLPSSLTEIFDNSCDLANVGVFTQNLLNQFGCDSTVITTVMFSDSDTTYLTATTCIPANAGVFEQLLMAASDGCDSLVVTTVNLLPSSTTTLTGQSCNPAEVGVFVQNLSNSVGCDSIVTTTITFNGIPTTFLTGISCNTAEVGVFDNIIVTPDGCDSLITTTISFIGIPPTLLTATTCDQNAAGVFTNVIVTADGCDSTVITTVNLLPSSTTALSGQSCNPAEVGVFVQNLNNQFGCDSIVTTTITFNGIPTTFLTGISCNPSEVGVFDNIIVTPDGCDSLITTTITFVGIPTTFLTGISCNVAEVGVFDEIIVTPDGCDSLITTTITFVGIPTTFLTTATCNPTQAGVFDQIIVTAGGCDSLVTTTVNLLPSNVVNLTGQDCNPANVGVFTQNLINIFGCDSTVITTIALLPSNTTALQSTSCDPAAVGVFVYPLFNIFGCDSIVTETITLLPSSVTTVPVTTCDPSQVGTIVTVLSNQFGCDSTVTTVTTLLPPASCGMTAVLAGSIIPCGTTTGTLTLTVTLGEGPFGYSVLLGNTPVANGTINAVGVPQTVQGLAPGNYTVNYTSNNGFTASAQAVIGQLFPPNVTAAITSSFGIFSVSCPGASDGRALASVTGGLAPFNYAWSSGGVNAAVTGLSAGNYLVTVTDANNCTNTAMVNLIEPQSLVISFTVNDPKCFGSNNGSIIVGVTGGIQPYRFAVNGGATQTSNVFAGLSPESYTITALDQGDCETSEIIVINTPIPLNVDLGSDISIELGDSVTLQAIVNVPFDSLASVIWTPLPADAECPQCLDQNVIPLISTTYSIQVVDVNGCRDDDRVVVIVDRRKYIYIPNIFSPNDDGDNDIFTVFPRPGTVRSIRSLQVYDRWGEQLYLNENFASDDYSIGWDGNFRGEPMNPGVYVWVVEVEFNDGVVELYKGDVTILR